MSASLSKNTADYRKRKIARGLCTYGGCWEPTTGRSIWLCPRHSGMHNAQHTKPPTPPRQCRFPDCTAEVVRPALLYCPDHNNSKSWAKAHRVKKLRSGMCTRNGCREPSREKRSTCAHHGALQSAKDMKRRGKIDEVVHATAD